jgi:acetyl-CoA C-acetyltransferase
MREAVIVATARAPIGRAYRGAFNGTHGAELVGGGMGAAALLEICANGAGDSE